MKHLKKSIAVFAGIALLLTACKKDDPGTIPPPEPIPSSAELQTYFDQNILDELQAFPVPPPTPRTSALTPALAII